MRGRLPIGALALVLIVSLAPVALADEFPHLVINTPDHGSTVSGTIDVTGNAWDDVQVLGVKVRIGDGDWLSAQDTSGNDTWWSWSYTWDTTTVPDGWRHIGVIAWDSSNQHTDASIEVFVDNEPNENTPPWAAIDEPAHGSTVRGVVTIRGRAGDEDAGDAVEMVQVRIDAGEWTNATPTGDQGSFNHWAFEWDTTAYDDGWHAVKARAFDGDVWGEPAVAEYLVDNQQDENRAPFAEILHPRNGETVHNIVLVHGVAGDPDDGDRVELVQVRIGDGEWRDAVDTSHHDTWSTWAYQWDTTQYDNGDVRVCARAYDGELYSEPNCREVKIANEHENEPPTVKILHPANGETVRGVVLVHGRAWDDRGVERVDVRFGDGDWRRTTDTSPDDSWTTWAYEWNTRERDDGCLVVAARAWDGSLFSEIHRIEVCVDNEDAPPVVTILHPEDGAVVHGLVLVHGTARDDHYVKRVDVRVDDGEWHQAHNTGRDRPWSTWAFEWDTTKYDNGEHEVCARAFDGRQYSELSCVTVIVHNVGHDDRAPPFLPEGASPLLAFGLLSGLGVAILMWLRSHGYLRK